MRIFLIARTSDGAIAGFWTASSRTAALDAFAVESGYGSYAAMASSAIPHIPLTASEITRATREDVLAHLGSNAYGELRCGGQEFWTFSDGLHTVDLAMLDGRIAELCRFPTASSYQN